MQKGGHFRKEPATNITHWMIPIVYVHDKMKRGVAYRVSEFQIV